MAGALRSSWMRQIVVVASCLVAAGCGTRVASMESAGGATTAAGARQTPASLTPSQMKRLKESGHTVPSTPISGVKQADFLDGVSCVSSRSCIAVGWYYRGSTVAPHTLVARWNGRDWQRVPSPSAGRTSALSAVSCASASACLAVGIPNEAWNGTRWRRISAAGPFSSVSCPAASSCQAVGVTAQGRPVSARWNGQTWRPEAVPLPRPAPQTVALAGVSCTSPAFCMAVGYDASGAGARPSPTYWKRTLAWMWNGSRWRIVPTASLSRAVLSAVSCTSSRSCVAVGSSKSGQLALAERWNGSTWAIEQAPAVNHIGYTTLGSVACAAVDACVAVGTYDGMTGVAERWNGSMWKLGRMPMPAGQGFVNSPSVSCPSAVECVMVGSTGTTLSEIWNGTTWAVARTPNPA